MSRFLLALLMLVLLPQSALAHKPSDSYLTIRGEPGDLQLRWDLALRDLDHAIGLDDDGNGAITWGEVRSHHEQIATYAFARLTLSNDAGACGMGSLTHQIDHHADGAYAVITGLIDCPPSSSRLSIEYDLLFDLDPQHRGLLSVTSAAGTTSLVITPDGRRVTVDLGHAEGSLMVGYLIRGAHHLLGGVDHLLFLLVVLLPITFGGRDRTAHSKLVETAKILTAFTLAHGLTLAATVLGYLALPSRPVEVVIALSIALTAIDNLKPFLGGRRWLIAGGFGLVHGLGFASVLGPLDLPPLSMATALFAFNLGIELAQLGIAMLLLPLGGLFHRFIHPASPMTLSRGGSYAALALACLWVIDRGFELRMMPF